MFPPPANRPNLLNLKFNVKKKVKLVPLLKSASWRPLVAQAYSSARAALTNQTFRLKIQLYLNTTDDCFILFHSRSGMSSYPSATSCLCCASFCSSTRRLSSAALFISSSTSFIRRLGGSSPPSRRRFSGVS